MVEKRHFDIACMTVFFGPGSIPEHTAILHSVRLAFALGGERSSALVSADWDSGDAQTADIVFLIDPDRCREVLGTTPEEAGTWHMTSEQRKIALALLHCNLAEPAAQTLRTAKAMELLCAVTTDLSEGRLVAADFGGALDERDSRRIMNARQLIDEEWGEKLTLNTIARACGLNRVKLTRGFRAMFDCTVAEAISERRLSGAYDLLLVTDLPVSSVGYRCGYNNNASFTRAFSRRYGIAPTQLRAGAVA
ncbi:MAG: AraC family transcriptional regulator [Sphingobium sp.]|nr:AraC family transcriptional regulator [Sphingobium sp.]